MFAILALPSTLASLNEKDNIVPEKDTHVEFVNKIMRGLDRLVTKVKKKHHAPIIESTVKVESAVEDSMLALHAESSKAGRNERLLVQADDGFELPMASAPANAQSPQEMQVTPDVSFLAATPPNAR